MTERELKLEEIYDTFKPKILRYLKRLVGEHEAEDLTQEVFTKIGEALKDFRGDSQISTWIYRIATNAALDRLRSSSFQQMTQEALSIDSEGGEEDKYIQFRGSAPSIVAILINT